MGTGTLTDSLTETLALFDGSGEPRTTTELAEELDLGRRSTYDRLDRLVEDDHLETKKVGANARVWWRPPATDVESSPSTDIDAGSAADDAADDHEEFESLVEAVEEYAIFTLDVDGEVRTWNPGARRIKGYERGEIVGEHFSQFYTEEDRTADVPERNLARAARDGFVDERGWRVRADGSQFWANVTITAIRDDEGELDGFAKVTRDMTERREYERQLREERDFTRRILETTPASIFVLDGDGEVVLANERFERQLGVENPEGDLTVGDLAVYDESGEPIPPAERPYRSVFETGEVVSDWRAEIERPDGERRWASINVAPIEDGGTVERVVVAARDVTELTRQERRLERQRDELEAELDDVFARIDDAFFALDTDWRFVHVNERAATVLDRREEKLLGRSVWEEFPEAVDSTFEEEYRNAMERQESVSFQEYYPPLDSWLQVHAYPSEEGLSVYFKDVSDHLQREHELERYETVVETMNDGVYVVDAGGRFTMVNDAYVSMVGLDREELLGSHVDAVIDDEDVLEAARGIEAELVGGESSTATLEAELGEDDDEVIGEATFAVFGDETDYERVGVVRDVTERKERELELERRRRQLAALNHLNGVVRDVTDAVIERSTREEIERTTCERLAAADSYTLAWIGEADPATDTVAMRTGAGVEGYLDGVIISIDPDDERSEGPTAQALRTGQIQVTHDVDAEDRHDPWRDHVEEYEFRSSAAIPIVHDETIYGVLNVYADRPSAFAGEERVVVEQLGEIVGHAIAAVERKRALMSDEVVELVFRIEGVLDALDIDADAAGPIRLEHVVEVGADEFVVYGSTTPAGVATVETMVAEIPFYDDLTVREDADDVAFELRLSEPPILSRIASLGGSVEEAVIEDGDYQLAIHVSPSVDVRGVIDAMMEQYPSATLLKRRQLTREATEADTTRRSFVAELTDRQRTAVEAAYHAGFFQWPRAASGEEVADALGIASPTFHQHLRKAEGKVFDALFAPGDGEE